MMGDPLRVGYEDLLKPLKDVLLKNWTMSLAHVLDEFISRLQNEGIAMNFSQAAILLQNSTTFYCKRVDVVFRIMEELTDGISQFKNEEASSTPIKKRRVARALENDDLELLDYVQSDHNIDLNWPKSLKPKQVVLNKDVKAVKKPNTVVPLVGSNGIFMGYKDDYRLYGKTWSDGTVNDDFCNRSHEVKFWKGSVETNGICDDNSHCDDRMDTCEQQEGFANGFAGDKDAKEGDCGDPILLDADKFPTLKELKINLCKVVDWDPVTFEFKFPLKVLKRRRVFSLPKHLLDEADQEMQRQKIRKLKREKKAAKLVNGSSASIENGLENTMDEGNDHCITEPVVEDVELAEGESEMLKFKKLRRESGLLATEVAKRVAEWHEAILPRIQEAEKRRKFNVHEYGSMILEKFPEDDQKFRPFSDVVVGQPKHEICRHFLSCLMLANTYNVEIRKSDNTPLATDHLELKLLSKVRHHDEMDEQIESLS